VNPYGDSLHRELELLVGTGVRQRGGAARGDQRAGPLLRPGRPRRHPARAARRPGV